MKLAVKVDVDTYRGTREGVPALCALFEKHGVPATFLFSLGPDNTGKALTRIFRKGFLKKCLRSNVAGNYGIKTLLYGTLLKAPQIGELCAEQMRSAKRGGFECGIHCWDHYKWQDYVCKMPREEIAAEFSKARAKFAEIFGESAQCCGAPGWQTSPGALEAQDAAGLLYASDTRDGEPFFPTMGGRKFKTLQIPSTLPTLDEILGLAPIGEVARMHLEKMRDTEYSVITSHAELEGMAYLEWFDEFLSRAKSEGAQFFSLADYARKLLSNRGGVPEGEIVMSPYPGRSGKLAVRRG